MAVRDSSTDGSSHHPDVSGWPSWLFVFMVWSCAMLVASAPYMWARSHTPPGYQFIGLVDKIPDGITYLAKMRQGLEGHWLFENRYSHQDHRPVFLNLFLLILGQVARFTGASLLTVFHAARLLLSLAMLGAVFQFYRQWLPEESRRRLALVLFAFASGVGWLFPWDSSGYWVRQQSVDLWMPEAVPFYAMMVNPLFCVSIALMAYVFTAVYHLSEGRPNRSDLGAVIAVVLLALIHPYDIIIVEVILFATLLMQALKHHRIERLTSWVALSLSPIPVVTFDAFVFHTNPVMRGWLNQNRTPSPHLLWYVTGYAPLLLFALIPLLNRASLVRLSSVAGVWLVLGLPLAYLPLGFQRKLIMGWSMPLAGFAAAGVVMCWSRRVATQRFVRVALSLCLVVTLGMSNVFLIARTCAASVGEDSLAYLRNEEMAAMGWLADHSQPRDTVLTSPRLGLFVPAFAGNRVLVGHWSETEDFFRMCGIANGFFSPAASAEHRSQILSQYGIHWVLSEHGALPNADDLRLLPVWKKDVVVVYERIGERQPNALGAVGSR